jgi:hypothetical protein
LDFQPHWFAFLKVFHDDGSTRLQLLVRKPLEDVTESDVKASVHVALNPSVDLSAGSHGDGSAAAASDPCGCCSGNLEKQRSGCNCCGSVLHEESDVASPHSVAQTSDSEVASSAANRPDAGQASSLEPMVGNTLHSDSEAGSARHFSDETESAAPPMLPTMTVTVKTLVGGEAWPITLSADLRVSLLKARR